MVLTALVESTPPLLDPPTTTGRCPRPLSILTYLCPGLLFRPPCSKLKLVETTKHQLPYFKTKVQNILTNDSFDFLFYE